MFLHVSTMRFETQRKYNITQLLTVNLCDLVVQKDMGSLDIEKKTVTFVNFYLNK